MTNTTMNPLDYLKYVAAEAGAIIEQVQDQLGGLELSRPVTHSDIEAALAQLDSARHTLTESAAAFCRDGHDLDTYGDGRPVSTRLDLEKGNYYVHRWHPYSGHRVNQPREVAVVTTSTGARRRIIVSAPGVLDAVDIVRAVE